MKHCIESSWQVTVHIKALFQLDEVQNSEELSNPSEKTVGYCSAMQFINDGQSSKCRRVHEIN